jgi:hypothetical protein
LGIKPVTFGPKTALSTIWISNYTYYVTDFSPKYAAESMNSRTVQTYRVSCYVQVLNRLFIFGGIKLQDAKNKLSNRKFKPIFNFWTWGQVTRREKKLSNRIVDPIFNFWTRGQVTRREKKLSNRKFEPIFNFWTRGQVTRRDKKSNRKFEPIFIFWTRGQVTRRKIKSNRKFEPIFNFWTRGQVTRREKNVKSKI